MNKDDKRKERLRLNMKEHDNALQKAPNSWKTIVTQYCSRCGICFAWKRDRKYCCKECRYGWVKNK